MGGKIREITAKRLRGDVNVESCPVPNKVLLWRRLNLFEENLNSCETHGGGGRACSANFPKTLKKEIPLGT